MVWWAMSLGMDVRNPDSNFRSKLLTKSRTHIDSDTFLWNLLHTLRERFSALIDRIDNKLIALKQ